MNTAVMRATPVLERYLKRATFGLGEPRRQAVWDELEEHILTRQDSYCLLGHDPETALKLAIRELGPALKLSAGMNRVHNMKRVFIASSGLAVAVSAILYAFAGGREPLSVLPVLVERPITPGCIKGPVPSGPNIKVISKLNGVTCFTFYSYSFPVSGLGPQVSFKDLKRAYKAAKLSVVIRSDGNMRVIYPNDQERIINKTLTIKGQAYADADSLIISTARSAITSRLELQGFDNPIVDFGEFRLQVGSKAAPMKGKAFYSNLAPTLIGLLIADDLKHGWAGSVFYPDPATIFAGHTVSTSLKPGEVVMVISKVRLPVGTDTSYNTDIVPVGLKGNITFSSMQRNLRFVNDLSQLSPNPVGGRTSALMVRLSNTSLHDLRTGIFLPAQATSDAP